MHPYSTNESRIKVYSILALLSVGIAWLIWLIAENFKWPQWLIGAPSVLGVYGVLYWLFDRRFWSSRLAHRTGLTDVPNLSGFYEGKVTSEWKDGSGNNVVRDISLEIQQTWTEMSVEMNVTSGSSTSRSISAVALISRDGSSARVFYVYRNEVYPGIADEDMLDHEGVADVRINADGALVGRYFNARPRKGTIQAKRKF